MCCSSLADIQPLLDSLHVQVDGTQQKNLYHVTTMHAFMQGVMVNCKVVQWMVGAIIACMLIFQNTNALTNTQSSELEIHWAQDGMAIQVRV